jgi:hypothetical protein
LAETGAIEWDGIAAICDRHCVPVAEVRMRCAMALKLWPQLAASFPHGSTLTEVELVCDVAPGVTLSGHLDLLAITGTVARGADWKTGRLDLNYSQQMKAYCALILLDNPELTEATMTIVWVMDGDAENYTMTREQLQPWLDELLATVLSWAGVYRHGDHCKHCRRNHECPAANAMVRRDVSAFTDSDLVDRAENALLAMSPAEIVSLKQRASLVASYAERVQAAIKAHVQKHGDVVADGVRLTIETQEKRKLLPLVAWPVLEAAGFKDQDFAEVIDLRVTKVEKRVATKAGRGKGAAAIRALDNALDDAGAIEVEEIQKLKTARV